MIPADKIKKNDVLYKYSNPRKAQENARKFLGEDTIIYKSDNKKKKYMVYDPFEEKFIYFGSLEPPYEDYLKHEDDIRRLRYLRRATKIRGYWYKDPYSPNSLSINILWN